MTIFLLLLSVIGTNDVVLRHYQSSSGDAVVTQMISSWTSDTFDQTSSGRPEVLIVLSLNVTVETEVKGTDEAVFLVVQFDRIALIKAALVIKFAAFNISTLLGLVLLGVGQLLAHETAMLSCHQIIR